MKDYQALGKHLRKSLSLNKREKQQRKHQSIWSHFHISNYFQWYVSCTHMCVSPVHKFWNPDHSLCISTKWYHCIINKSAKPLNDSILASSTPRTNVRYTFTTTIAIWCILEAELDSGAHLASKSAEGVTASPIPSCQKLQQNALTQVA